MANLSLKTLQDAVDYKIGADAVLVVASDAQTEDSIDFSLLPIMSSIIFFQRKLPNTVCVCVSIGALV